MAAIVKKHEKKTSIPDKDCSTICLPDRDAKIAELAYYKAENRDFAPGYELEDWLQAEQEFCCNGVSQTEPEANRNALLG